MQLTLAQLKTFGIRPDTSFGQHFLVDNNILDVIGSLANLEEHDVVFEPGVGVGVLTNFLAHRTNYVHGIEVDFRLKDAINQVTSDLDNVMIHWQDAAKINPSLLEPKPNKLVSNLPYNVATPIVAENVKHSRSINHFCVMVQREVADRFFANPRTKAYGAISVLLGVACNKTGFHPVSRGVFIPPPNVDSALIAFSRKNTLPIPWGDLPRFHEFVKSAFLHRRKTLINNLHNTLKIEKVVSRKLLDSLDLKVSCRPEELTPTDFIELFKLVDSEGIV